jgi:hypothetical protein
MGEESLYNAQTGKNAHGKEPEYPFYRVTFKD